MPRYHAYPLVNITDSISHQRGNQAQTFGLSSGPPCNEQLSAPSKPRFASQHFDLSGLGKRVLGAPNRAPSSPSCHKSNKAKSQSLAIKVSRPNPSLCLNTLRLLLVLRGSAVFQPIDHQMGDWKGSIIGGGPRARHRRHRYGAQVDQITTAQRTPLPVSVTYEHSFSLLAFLVPLVSTGVLGFGSGYVTIRIPHGNILEFLLSPSISCYGNCRQTQFPRLHPHIPY